jgi:hypothetical protein
LIVKGEFDKGGRFLTYFQHWAVTSAPTGSPLVCLANNNYLSAGAKITLKRSRGTFENPLTVNKDDNVFRLVWEAHDGISYKEVSSISVDVSGDTKSYSLPTDMSFKTTNNSGNLELSAKITKDQTLQVNKIESLSKNELSIDSPLKLPEYTSEADRDLQVKDPRPGTLIFLNSSESVQVFTKKAGWISLN